LILLLVSQFKLYLSFADTSCAFVYREVNAVSCVENGATILKRKSGEDLSVMSFVDHIYVVLSFSVYRHLC
jgi:hypothetical protein